MKKHILIIILLIGPMVELINAQPDKTSYIVINLPPMYGTTVELGYERNSSPLLAFELFVGYLINNSTIESPTKIGTVHNFKKKSGFFIKPGARFNLRTDPSRFAPFFGLHLVNSLAIEQGVYYDGFPDYETKIGARFSTNSYNLGLTGMIGLTTPLTTRIGGDVGIQAGKLLVNNLIDFHSYMPGMGVNIQEGLRIQGIVRIKYKIN